MEKARDDEPMDEGWALYPGPLKKEHAESIIHPPLMGQTPCTYVLLTSLLDGGPQAHSGLEHQDARCQPADPVVSGTVRLDT